VVGVMAELLKELPKEAGAKRKRPTTRKRECGSAHVNLTEEVEGAEGGAEARGT
jgi:hypothetical protein